VSARILVSTGEPAGIGPDISLALAMNELPATAIFLGNVDMLRERARVLGIETRVRPLADAREATPHSPGLMQVLDSPLAVPVVAGSPDIANATYVLELLDCGARLCLDGTAAALVTAPVQKSVINETGIPFSGHTEYLAERTEAALPVMMLVGGTLRVALVTTHLALKDVAAFIDEDRLVQTIHVLAQDLERYFGIARPRIRVLGLNPHAGERGVLGREEIEIIAPALEALRQRGLTLLGPSPADTAFTPDALADVDAVLAMYHDQGLPVIKALGFGRIVNVTLGLPIVRTSVDHGTALELAGTGKANAASLEDAYRLAERLAQDRAP
jgi:4-hydroxythreonine-4-phosphate dehydrogenase